MLSFQNFKNIETVLYEQNSVIPTAVNFNFKINENSIIICGGEFFRKSGILKGQYKYLERYYFVYYKLYFGIFLIIKVSNIGFNEDLKNLSWYPSIVFKQ